MRWLRLHRRPGGWVALLALALQLALSFGHVHGIHAAGPVAALAAADQAGAPAGPSGHDGPNDPDYCAICAVLSLLAGAQTATAPALALPTALTASEPLPSAEKIFSEPQRIAFRSRAPPQA